MKLPLKISIIILVAVKYLFYLFLVLASLVACVLVVNDIIINGNYKEENYYQEEDLTEIAFNRDWYLYKINDELFISVNYSEKFEVKKANKEYINNYSDLDIYSDTIFEGKNPLYSYYLIKDNKLYIKNDEIKKCIDLETSQISDFGNENIKGDWDSLQ